MAKIAEHQGLREFAAVVEHGGFTRAAGELAVSTSYVSRQVRRLEERLGARLLNRTTRNVSLTDLGRTYYTRCREILDQLSRLESDMADLQRKPVGRVRVTAAGIYAERFVAPAIAAFNRRYPDVEVELDTRMGIVDIVGEGFDLAVRLSALEDSSLVARKVADRRMMVAASPDYLERHGAPRDPEALRQHNCLRLHNMAWRFAFAQAVRNVAVRGSWVSDNGRALVAAAVAGLGLVRLTDYYMDEEIADGRLVVVLEDYEPSDVATWLIYPDRHYLPTRVRFLVDHLAATLR